MSFGPGKWVVAKFEYKASGVPMSTGDVDLSFGKGDTMRVVEVCPNNWLKVDKDGIMGVIPSPYVKLHPGPPPSREILSDKGTAMEALWSYRASGMSMSSGDVDLSFQKKDRMILLDRCPNDWLRVQLRGKIGVVPSNYLRPLRLSDVELAELKEENITIVEDKSVLTHTLSAFEMRTQVERDPRRTVSSPEFPEGHSIEFEKEEKRPSLERKDSTTSSSRLKMMKVLGVASLDQKGTKLEEPRRDSVSTDYQRYCKYILSKEYAFSAEDSNSNILFTMDKTDQIRAATLLKLVERLTYPDYADPDYMFEFLLTYRSFATSSQLLDLLIQRFNLPIPEEVKKDKGELEQFERHVLKPIRLRVFNVLKRWIDGQWHEFLEFPSVLESLKVFIEGTMKQSGMENAAENLTKMLIRKQEGQQVQSNTVFPRSPPDAHQVDVKQLSGCDSLLTFLVFNTEEVARQLTLIEHEWFTKITPTEFLGQSWTKKDKQTKAPNILGMIQRFNGVSMWVTGTIVQIEKLKDRAEALGRLIDIAVHLKALNNFNGIMEVLAGLRSSSVHRLKKTWALLHKDKLKAFEELLDLMSPDGNYTKFRKFLHSQISPPCIPYLGVYLTDLTFLEDGNPDNVAELINFDKRRRVAAVIKEIKQYQQEPYCLHVVPIIRGFLLASGEYVDENSCYTLSLAVEPRDGKTKVKGAGKSWRKSSAVMKKEELNRRGLSLNLYRQSAKEETKQAEAKATPSPQKEVKSKSSPNAITLQDLVQCLMEGNSIAVEQYLASLDNKTTPEKELLRAEINRLFEEEMDKKGAERVNVLDAPEQDQQEIPFEELVGFLQQGDTAAFESYFEEMEIYQAERIRQQVIKRYTGGTMR